MGKSTEKELHSPKKNKPEEEQLHPFIPMRLVKEESDRINLKRKEDFIIGLDCPYPEKYKAEKITELKSIYDKVGKPDPITEWSHDQYGPPIYSFGWRYFEIVRYVPDETINWPESYFEFIPEDEDSENGFTVFIQRENFPQFIQGYADAALVKFIEDYCHDLTNIDDNIGSAGAQWKQIEDLKNETNAFDKSYDMKFVINEFIWLTTEKNKNGEKYLTGKDLSTFLQKGFLRKKGLPKVRLNIANGETGAVISRFHTFFSKAVGKFNAKNKQGPYIDLIIDCFENWQTEDKKKVKAKFRRQR